MEELTCSEAQDFVLLGLGERRPGPPVLLVGNLRLQGPDSASSQIPLHSANEGLGESPARCQVLLG